jgi:dipeptidyl aminopeptidase/acylaminoacyl peptidase
MVPKPDQMTYSRRHTPEKSGAWNMPATSLAEPTDLAARYANAEQFLPHNVKKLIDSPQARPVWIRDTETFWYRNLRGGRTEFVLVDAAAGTKAAAFDNARLAEGLKGVLEGDIDPDALPITEIDLIEGGLRLVANGQPVEVSLDTYTVKALGPARPFESASPDGRWSLFLQDHNLFVRDLSTDEVRQLTTDGVDGCTYGAMPDFAVVQTQQRLGVTLPPAVVWSPDSTRFVTHKLDQRNVGLMHLVRSSPEAGGRPQLLSYHYACAGDADESLATSEYIVFDAVSGQSVKAAIEPEVVPFVPMIGYGRVWWSADGSKYYVVSTNRGDTQIWLTEFDAATGAAQRIVEEGSDTHINLGPQHQENNVRTLASGEVLWWSQRTDWGHLYLYGRDGAITTLTSGEWLVRNVVSVDEDARRVVFTAAGRLAGSDPYLQELCSVSLDGGEITTITADGLDHDAAASLSGRHFVDITSRYDVPTVSVLRNSTGEVVMELERADATALYAAGWAPPERVVVKAADGVTDIYCAIHKPHGFDPSKKYAVLDEIYPGPQVSGSQLRFPQSGGPMIGTAEYASHAALGFVLVTIDARGSAMRSKSFQDYARRSGNAIFPDDHAEAIKQLAADRPWMDLDRVGIFGHSAGGYGATRVLLERPDVYRVAVASCGNHDNRVNHAWWGEKFFGLAEDFDFEAQSNASLADKLEGKLYLIHGEMDDNAVAHATMRLVDALITANKDFDMLVVPNAIHPGVVLNGYWVRKRWDYLVQHLMGATPPRDYRIADIPLPF